MLICCVLCIATEPAGQAEHIGEEKTEKRRRRRSDISFQPSFRCCVKADLVVQLLLSTSTIS